MSARLTALLLVPLLAVGACSDDDDDPTPSSADTTTSTADTTSSSGDTTTSTADTAPATTAPTTTAPAATAPVTAGPAFSPGDPCPLGSDYDCIDPDGDGQGVYLIGGGDCMASPIAGGLCSDLDGDGHAGYPDSG